MTDTYSHTNYYYENADKSFCIVLATDFNEAAQSPPAHDKADASLYFEGTGCFFTDDGKYVETDGTARNGAFEFVTCTQAANDKNTLIADTGKGIVLTLSFSEDGQTMTYDGAFMHGKHHETDTLKLAERQNWPKP